jgi:hypothetical protein
MPFVLDASMTMTWCFADESTPYSRRVLQLLLNTYAEVPAVWVFEVANVLAVGDSDLIKAASQESVALLGRES